MKASIKNFLIIGIILLLAIVYLLWQSQQPGAVQDVAPIKERIGLETSSIDRVDVGTNTNFPVKDSSGGTVSVRDFQNDPGVSNWGDDNTLVLGDGLIAEDPAFQIFYYQSDRSFSIAILQEPISDVRKVAEAQLLERLQISTADACKLIITVTVPSFVNENISGQNLGLSFCPDAVQL
jgi:hypothetical protein